LCGVAKLSPYVRGSIRQFAHGLANGTVGGPVLEGVDYRCIFEEPSALEAAVAVYLNVLEVDDAGVVTNGRAAEGRAAQYIRAYCDPGYVVDPPFADGEVELHPASPDRWTG
jgi:hypothetical protein